MGTIAALAALVFGLVGAITGIYSLAIQSRQTEIMEAGLEKALDVDSTDSDTGTAREKRVRGLINRRLADVRYTMRQEFNPRFTEIEERLKDANYQTLVELLLEIRNRQAIATQEIANASREVSEQAARFAEEIAANAQQLLDEARRVRAEIATSEQRILAESGRYESDIAAHGSEIENLAQQIGSIREVLNSQEQTRVILRSLGEQLLRMSD